MKTCSKCGKEKDKSEFHKRKDSKDGLRDQCKVCVNARKAEWADANREWINAQKREYYNSSPERREKKKESTYRWRRNNKEVHNRNQRKWRAENPEKSRESQRKFRENNVEKLRRVKREYMRENSGYYSQKSLERQKRLDREDPDFRYARSLRGSFRNVLYGRNSKKMSHLDHRELIKKIEMQFVEGMDWSNYGTDWHIDHKKPMIRFFRQGEYRPSIIYALSNLQPMWASENCSKRDTFH